MIEISKLTKTYEKSSRALKDVSLTIDDGEFVFITGRSGSGKSTLLRILLKEVEPTSGRVVVNDMDLGRMPRRYVPKYRRQLGVVFQDFRLLKDRNVYENVAFAQRVIGVSGRKIRESVPEMLRMVGLSSKYKSFQHQLSGSSGWPLPGPSSTGRLSFWPTSLRETWTHITPWRSWAFWRRSTVRGPQ